MSNVANLSDYQTQEVVIDGITVKQDAEGRYCLNDVHKASGGAERHKPVHWWGNDSTRSLVYDLKVENPTFEPIIAKRGRTGGTFAVKELVYAYAMWISPSYHLRVIRAYDRMVTDGVAVHENSAQDLLDNPLKYIGALMSQAQALVDENERLSAKVEKDKPKIQVFNKFIDADGLYGFQEFCTEVNVNQRKIKLWMRDIGWLRASRWEHQPLPTAKAVGAGYCDIKNVDNEFGFRQVIKFTEKAKAYVELKAPDYVRKKVPGIKMKKVA